MSVADIYKRRWVVAISAALLLIAAIALAPRASQFHFERERVGPAPFEHPTITNVQIVDLDRDGSRAVVACDAQRQAVYAYRRQSDGTWTEEALGEGLIAPAHATVVDLDQDGDNDVVVSVMGNLYPDDDLLGSLVLLERRGDAFVKRTLLDDVRRVVDAQPGDFDGDGDLDLAVAVFGYLRGQVLWLENRGAGQFRDHELLSAAGTIHVPVGDYDGDGDLDVAAVVSQNDEEVWGFENLGGGKFTPRRLWMTINYDIGTAGLVATDLDNDEDLDFLLPVGDNLEDSYSIPQPYHGCLWLENKGSWNFAANRIATFPGTYAAAAGDLDGDGDQDVALVSMVNHWDDRNAPSLVWLENNGRQEFTQHSIAADPIMLVTVACSDVDQDGRLDLVAGGLHMHPPYQRMGRITCWLSSAGPVASNASDATLAAAPKAEARSAAGVDNRPPLADLSTADAITRRDIRELYDRLDAKAAEGSTDAPDWLELGKSYYVFGYFAAATQCLQEAVERDTKSELANYLVGTSLARRGLFEDAIAQLRRTLPLASPQEQQWIWYEIGRCYLRLEDAVHAEDAFVQSGRFAGSLAQLVKLRLRAGRAAEASAPLDELSQLEPQATEVFLLKARVAEALGNAGFAQKCRDYAEYNSAVMPTEPVVGMIHPMSVKYGLGHDLTEAKAAIDGQRWEQAATLLSAIVREQPNDDAVLLLAGAELKCKRPERTIALLESQFRRRGRMPVGMVLMGDAFAASGQAEKAESWWAAAMSLRSSPTVHEQLAAYYEQAGRADDARRQRALALEANGVAALRHSNPGAARALLAAAVALDPSLPRAQFYLGECCRLLGDFAAARRAYGDALVHAPNHGRARAALALVGG